MGKKTATKTRGISEALPKGEPKKRGRKSKAEIEAQKNSASTVDTDVKLQSEPSAEKTESSKKVKQTISPNEIGSLSEVMPEVKSMPEKHENEEAIPTPEPTSILDDNKPAFVEDQTENDQKPEVSPETNKPAVNSSTGEINETNIDQEINNAPAVEPTMEQASKKYEETIVQSMSQKPQPVVSSEKNSLWVYAEAFKNQIRNHWRLMTIAEINELISRGNYPFKVEINHRKEQANEIFMNLVSETETLRCPQNEEEFIRING